MKTRHGYRRNCCAPADARPIGGPDTVALVASCTLRRSKRRLLNRVQQVSVLGESPFEVNRPDAICAGPLPRDLKKLPRVIVILAAWRTTVRETSRGRYDSCGKVTYGTTGKRTYRVAEPRVSASCGGPRPPNSPFTIRSHHSFDAVTFDRRLPRWLLTTRVRETGREPATKLRRKGPAATPTG